MASPSPDFAARSVPARAFARSLSLLLKYVRLYGFDHKHTSGQFETAWNELRNGVSGTCGLLLGVAGSKLLLDGVALETTAAEHRFTELLSSAGIASIQFSRSVTVAEFECLIQAFALSKPAAVLNQLKLALPQGPNASIRLNEVRYVEDDHKKNETDLAAELTTRALPDSAADKLSSWLNDPQKLLQLIFAAQGAGKTSGAGNDAAAPAGAPGAGQAGATPLEESEVVGLMRWLTQLGKVEREADPQPAAAALQAGLSQLPGNSLSVLQQTIAHIATLPVKEGEQGSMLIKLAEHLAIRFALERYERGEVRVNAVREMLERMNSEMENLRRILRSHEATMGRSGVTVESHTEILDRQFWAAVPERGKLGVLLSPDASCVPSRNLRSFVEELMQRGDNEVAAKILRQYADCIASSDPEAQRKTAIGLSDIADLYTRAGADLLGSAIQQIGEQLSRETVFNQRPLLSAAFVRLSQEANNSRDYSAIVRSLDGMQQVERCDPALSKELRPRIAVEGRVREFVEDGLRSPALPAGLADVLKRVPRTAVEDVAVRFSQCMMRQECERLLEILSQVGDAAIEHLRLMLARPAVEAVLSVGPRSRLDFRSLERDLPQRAVGWGRLQQHELVRQMSFGGATERGRLLSALLAVLDPMILALAVEEIGMSGDRIASPDLLKLAERSGAAANSDYVRIKAVEALGRLRENRAGDILAKLVSGRSLLAWQQPRELRIASAQALLRIDQNFGQKILANSGLTTEEMQFGPLDADPTDWARARRYPRVRPARPLDAVLQTSKGRTSITLTQLSLGGGLAIREGHASLGPEAVLELSSGLRRIRANTIVRENRARELAFEILNIDVENLGRLRRVLIEHMPASIE